MEKTHGPLRKGKRTFFRAYVELIRPFLKKIRTREADVLAELSYNYDINTESFSASLITRRGNHGHQGETFRVVQQEC